MLRINQIRLPVDHTEEELKKKISKKLGLKIIPFHYEIIRQSIDARKKPEIYYSYVIDVEVQDEQSILKKLKDTQVVMQKPLVYRFPYKSQKGSPRKLRPVIIGFGPAGLFCGYMLAMNGFQPIILERGESVEERERAVEKFWQSGILNSESNVQFGEGGAGTFSDGKLNTLVKDKDGRGRAVLSVLVSAGAPENILYDYKPHIGTDVLKTVVTQMRQTIIAHGGEVRFGQKVTGFLIEDGHMAGVRINQQETLAADQVVLAIGHSARDTFSVLQDAFIPMEAKAFAVGLRVEHPQRLINLSQYGREEHPILGAAPYKVVSGHAEPSVYSFCMCPGGYVVNASSEEGRTAVNGMSYSHRAGENANSAIVVTVLPKDYGDGQPLSGIAFQRQLEEKAFAIGKGQVPVEYYKEYKQNVLGEKPADGFSKTIDVREFQPAIKGQWRFAPVHEILPAALNQAFVRGMTEFGRQIKGFDDDYTLISGVESRTSSPVRILRDETLQSAVRGLFPCGEGAGYAGGIMSAAMDGIKVAEAVAGSCINLQNEL